MNANTLVTTEQPHNPSVAGVLRCLSASELHTSGRRTWLPATCCLVSALVAELERVTELTLLEQWGKRLALTDEGRELYVHAQQVVAAADEAW